MTIRIGIIGAGGIGTLHAETATNCGATLLAVCDADPARALKLATRFHAKATSDRAELLAMREIDAVYVAVPNIDHASVAISALQAGKHVFLEKPMAMSVAECDGVIDAMRAAGRVVQIGFVSRNAPAAQAAKRIIEAGTLGTIYHVKAAMYRRRGIPGLGRWFTTRRSSGGGALIDIGVHVIDLAVYLANARHPQRAFGISSSTHGVPIESYTGTEMWAGPRDPGGVFDVEDAIHALVRFDGMSLELNAMWAGDFPQGALRDGFVILGTRGGCHLDLWGNKFTMAYEENGYMCDVTPELGKGDPWREAWETQFRSFAAAVISGTPPRAGAEDGRRVQTIVEAIYRSCATGRDEAVLS